jgi:hypothetical protein
MIKSIIVAGTLLLALSPASAQVHVDGYTRSNGTYVAPHYRSAPDNSHNNNYSTQGNVNPYTGLYGSQPRTYDDNPPSGYNTYSSGGSKPCSGWNC